MTPDASTRELRQALASLRGYFKTAAAFSVVVNLLALAPAIYMLEVYQRVVPSRSAETLLMLTLLVVAIHALMAIVDWVRQRILQAAGERLDRMLGERVFNSAFEARLRSLDVGIAPLLDLRAVRTGLAFPATLAIMDAPVSLLLIAVVFVLSVPLGFVVLVAAVAMLIVAFLAERRTLPLLSEAQRLAHESQRYLAATLRNAQAIETMGMTENFRSRWLDRQRGFLVRQAKASDHAGGSAAVAKLIQVCQSAAVLGIGCWLSLRGDLDPNGSTMIFAWILSTRALAPLQELVVRWKAVVGVRNAYHRLEELLESVPPRVPGMPLPAPHGALSVESVVAMAAGTQVHVLRGISFSLAPGEVMAIVGPTASGKSTLARLLVGLWPAAAGKVLLDGVDVYARNKEELGPHLGYLAQDDALLDGTIAENIARFGLVDSRAVEVAATVVGLHETVLALPDGYGTRVGSAGSVLSGGVRRRVALARAIYGEPRYVVLDEPNSNLDDAGETMLLQMLLHLKGRGTTFVVVTHRTRILAAVDRMLVLRDGQAQYLGPRDKVLAAMSSASKGPAGNARPATSALAAFTRSPP